jgi:hypothetical protein
MLSDLTAPTIAQGRRADADPVPAVLLGSWTGWKIYGWLSERQFVRMLSVLLIGSGLLLNF